jgi:hypothetical protein
MGIFGVNFGRAMAQPTGINKKKVKKMLQRKKLVSRHFMEALEARIGNQ